MNHPRPLDSHPHSRVRNSQPHGIGRVAEIGDLVAWNNLGRNVVFADRALRPLCSFDETDFPDQDEPSQFDLDIHGIVRPAGTDWVWVLNHLGALRAFSARGLHAPPPERRARPIAQLHFALDAERLVAAGDRLVASRAGPEGAGGLLVSAPVVPAAARSQLAADPALDSWGPVTALAASSSPTDDAWVAVGAEQRIAIAPLCDGRLGPPRWEVEVPWRSAWLEWEAPLLWVAGSDPPSPDVGDYQWDELRGGGFSGLHLHDGRAVVERAFGRDLAWGNGGAAVCKTEGALYGLDRGGSLHGFRLRDGHSLGSTRPLATRSLGIAHSAAVGRTVLAGFSRAGYRLFAYPVSEAAPAERADSTGRYLRG